jgi:hypothetical protein
VWIATWAPVYERAWSPRFSSASASSPIVTCSPVAAIWSNSRGLPRGCTDRASLSRRSVSPDMADTTTTTWWPCARAAATLPATCSILSTEPMEVPPYFWTMRDMVLGRLG